MDNLNLELLLNIVNDRLTSRKNSMVQRAAEMDIAAVQRQGKKYGYLARNVECVPYCVFGSAKTPPRSGL